MNMRIETIFFTAGYIIALPELSIVSAHLKPALVMDQY